MKIKYQILLGFLPISVLMYVFISASIPAKGQDNLALCEKICKQYHLILSAQQSTDTKHLSLADLKPEIIKKIKLNSSQFEQEKNIKFLINPVDISIGDHSKQLLIITQKKVYKSVKTFFTDPPKVHVAVYANGLISHLTSDQYNKLDLTHFIYIDQIEVKPPLEIKAVKKSLP
ncbi:hypothetical protein PQO03_08300 [Lentisphaera profundi]|uniref:Uncharacterized protein n=1 Tax=Lentisphaera profundi TaxID=1658616 RepID=A0ABY7VNL2_9BACT|nr:hypothetical protein [Lentisphaera profundi]WDE95715.1 hypothetical protein PQO03_08300 [Lentisphaera profundi]